MDEQMTVFATQFVQQLKAQGVPLLDNLVSMPLDQSEDRVGLTKEMFDSLPSGLTHFIFHPAQDTLELRAIAPDWSGRVADYRAFTSEELRNHVGNSGMRVIGYRTLRELI